MKNDKTMKNQPATIKPTTHTTTKGNHKMKTKFRILLATTTFIAGAALLFAALVLPGRLAAQDDQTPDNPYGHCILDSNGRTTGYCLHPPPIPCFVACTTTRSCRRGVMGRSPGTIGCGNIFHNCTSFYTVDLLSFCR